MPALPIHHTQHPDQQWHINDQYSSWKLQITFRNYMVVILTLCTTIDTSVLLYICWKGLFTDSLLGLSRYLAMSLFRAIIWCNASHFLWYDKTPAWTYWQTPGLTGTLVGITNSQLLPSWILHVSSIKFNRIVSCALLAQFSLNNIHKGGNTHLISF